MKTTAQFLSSYFDFQLAIENIPETNSATADPQVGAPSSWHLNLNSQLGPYIPCHACAR